jgi:ABC-type transport system substrate-binding protein
MKVMKAKKSLLVLITLMFAIICAYLLLNFIPKWNSKVNNNSLKKSVTELIVTPFGYPHPYHLEFVAQYRFVDQVGEYLIRKDQKQNIIGGLAKSWTISEDRHSIRFYLRENIYSASEVKESLVRVLKYGQTSHSSFKEQISSLGDIKVIDSLTLEIKTKGDASSILSPLYVGDMIILPDDHWIKINDREEVDWKKTRGPYIVSKGNFPLKEGESIELEPNPKHYFYNNDLLSWSLEFHPITKFKTFKEFEELFLIKPSYTTIRYWDLQKIFYDVAFHKQDVLHYETKINGVSFIIPNLHSAEFKNKDARLQLAKNILNSKLLLLDEGKRAYQIAQPGLVGRMSEDELKISLDKIKLNPQYNFIKPLKWLIPVEQGENTDWFLDVAEKSNIKFERIDGKYFDVFNKKMRNNSEYDVALTSIGMADNDPISGATFLFSKNGLGQDFHDQKILNILNSTKATSDSKEITYRIKNAFKTALEEGIIIPISYVTNRHYYSKNVKLNIIDPFSESVQIWQIRLD